jgi:hypothetical protein
MDKKYNIKMITFVVVFVISGISNFLYIYKNRGLEGLDAWLFYANAFVMVGAFFFAVLGVLEWRKCKKSWELGETLFLNKCGAIPDKIKILSVFTYKYDQITQGISSHSVRIKFWSQGKVYKGIIDIKKENLYIKEPMLLPMHTGDSVSVWKDITAVHQNTMPKRVEYRDADENLSGLDYLDEEGNLKKGSLRRYNSKEVYWFPEKEVWEP